MGKQVYSMWKARPTAAFLQLAEEEQGQYWAGLRERHEKAGVKSIVVLDTHWSTEQWYFAGVAEYQDIDALRRFERMQQEANVSLYFAAEHMLGTKMEES